LEAGRERFAGKEERQGQRELRRKIAELERTLGKKMNELEIAVPRRARCKSRVELVRPQPMTGLLVTACSVILY